MKKVKLSQLNDDVKVSIEESHTVYTVAELKREIIELGEPHHESSNWFTVIRRRWAPDANHMIDIYIQSEYDNMYEDWDERAMDCLTDDLIRKIQNILDDAFKGDYATEYWEYEKPVEIDVFPEGGQAS